MFISTDAPARVSPGSRTEITVTVVDDEGVRAGAQTVEVTQVAGSGVTRNGGPESAYGDPKEIVAEAEQASQLKVDLVSGSSTTRPADGIPQDESSEVIFRVRLLDNQETPDDFAARRSTSRSRAGRSAAAASTPTARGAA